MSGFSKWLDEVDMLVAELSGVSVHDLADYGFRDAYEDGASPAEVAEDVLSENGWDG